MKKVLMMCLVIVFVVSLFAEIMPVKTDKHTAVPYDFAGNVERTVSRDRPEWDWDVPPQGLLTNYADYFQCYNHLPISLQPEEHGGGIYIMYRVKDQAENSEISYSYIDNMGVVQASQGIGSVGYYADAIVDQNTGDVFGTWHLLVADGSSTYDCIAIYDLYHIMLSHGLWKDPVITVLNSDDQDELDPTLNDEFIWPQIAIGPSPVAGKQRIYIVASNHQVADGSEANPSENVMIMVADFNQDDLDLQSDLEWTYNTIPVLDSWNSGDPYWYRPFKSFTVIDNQLIFMGYKISGDAAPDQTDQMFCFINDNYGEGDNWSYNYEDWAFPEDNPSWEWNGTTWHIFEDHAGYPDDPPTYTYTSIEQGFIHTGHFNLVPTHNNTRVTWPGAMGYTFDSGSGPGYYWLTGFLIYPKTFSFDLINEEFSFTDVYPMGANPNDDLPSVPWDLDEDGEIDEFTADDDVPPHYPLWFEDWPIFHFDPDAAFHYNEYYLTTNDENGWMAYIWVDGTYAVAANEGWTGYEDWVAKPELVVVVSNDWGMTWSEPIFMNANPNSENYVEELDGMIPCFAYPGDRIEDDGDGYGIVHLFFLDDNDYGSYHGTPQHGLNNGSTFEYAAMRVEFGTPPPGNDDNEVAVAPIKVNNYPNPFNPSTTIAFETQVDGNVVIDVYNVKGQLVNSLVNDNYDAGKHTVTWNGTDDNGNTLPSGVYFYNTKCGRYTTSKKMILMK
ncbi:MAG: T9SS type A sorting domain-containing protein [Candidatus Cloacimonetes bacterium]|nr:T9SS type A sorting domain-containing protein [Candidatus Cloacimonadota bacterium]